MIERIMDDRQLTVTIGIQMRKFGVPLTYDGVGQKYDRKQL